MLDALKGLFGRKPPAVNPAVLARFQAVSEWVTRNYHAADGDRLTDGWRWSNSSADGELVNALPKMRGRSRALIRDASYAKRAKLIVQNNVIGSGIGMQAQIRNNRGRLQSEYNDPIEAAWQKWSRAEYCHTGGSLCFGDFERIAMGEVFEAGEVLIRVHNRPFGGSDIPYALELIEPERLAEQFVGPVNFSGRDVRMGVELDEYQRPVAYWVQRFHPGDIRGVGTAPNDLIRIPADQMIHMRIVDRWPQTRGEPWLHTAMRRLNDMDRYGEAEIVAARGAAAFMGFYRTPDGQPLAQMADDPTATQLTTTLEPGLIEQLPPGYDITMNNPNRPNPNMDPFMRMMLREVASGVGVSYESLSRDYSQSNYSSSRLALLDDRDCWRVLQAWFIRTFRYRVHREWLRQAVLARAIPAIDTASYIADPDRYEAVRFKPRGWSWVDPTKEVDAFEKAVQAGFMTVSDVISQTGGGQDIEDVLQERRQELDMMEELDLEFSSEYESKAEQQAQQPQQPEPDPEGEAQSAPVRIVSMRG